MTIGLSNLNIEAELPEIEPKMKVHTVVGATMEERRQAIDFFQETLNLNKLYPVDVQDSIHLMSENGMIQYYRPSGAIWAHNATADDQFPDERRPWKIETIKDPDDLENLKMVLQPEQEKQLLKSTEELFKRADLLSDQAYFAGVELDQVAKLNKKGTVVDHFPGEATARFLYKLDGVPVDGAGAKSYAFFNPVDDGSELTGVFHCWRKIKQSKDVRMFGIEEALEGALSQDRELALYYKRDALIKISKVELVYMSLPPHKFQDYIFPALRTLGSVIPERGEKTTDAFGFAKFYNAIPAEHYAKADLYADYLFARL